MDHHRRHWKKKTYPIALVKLHKTSIKYFWNESMNLTYHLRTNHNLSLYAIFNLKGRVSSSELREARDAICRGYIYLYIYIYKASFGRIFIAGSQMRLRINRKRRLRGRYLYLSAGREGRGVTRVGEHTSPVCTRIYIHSHGTVAIDYRDVSGIRAYREGRGHLPPLFLRFLALAFVARIRGRNPIPRQWLMFPRGSVRKLLCEIKAVRPNVKSE